jgi:hypothetical protein
MRTQSSIDIIVNDVRRLFSSLGDPLARIRLTEYRHLPLWTDTLRFQIESRLNVPLRHPSAVEALGILYMIKGDV